MAITDKTKVQKYLPKNSGLIHAVQWTGKAECLIGLPEFNEVVSAIQGIDRSGLLRITCTGDEDTTHVRPFKDFVAIDGFGNLVVYLPEFMQNNYNIVPEEKQIRERQDRDNRVGQTITIIAADRPDDT